MGRPSVSMALMAILVVSRCYATVCDRLPKADDRERSPVDEVQTALIDAYALVDASSQPQQWRAFLMAEQLQAELARGNEADSSAVAAILSRYCSGVPGTDRPQFLRVARALEQWLAHLPPPSFDRLLAAAASAKSVFVPLTRTNLERARAELTAAVQRLEARLEQAGDSAEGWRSFLKWDALGQELASEAPDLSLLDTIYARLSSGHDGLDLAVFRDVADRLRHYLVIARTMDEPALEDQYRQVLDLLTEHLRAYRADPNPDDAQLIRQSLDWLHETDQAGWLVALVRRYYWHPNLYLQVSGELVTSLFARPVDDVNPVEDCILGTAVFGKDRFVGQVTSELVPSGHSAAVDLIVRATSNSDTIGYNGPVRVFSNGVTTSVTRKRLLLTEDGFTSQPAAVNAVTRSNIRYIDAGGRRLIERFAWRRAMRQKPEAEQVAADHAEAKIGRRFNEETAEQLDESNENYQENYRRPLVRRKLFPAILNFSTTREFVHATGLQAPLRSDLAAPGGPPAAPGQADVGIRMHESMINNFARGLYGGMIVHEEDLRQDVADLLGYVPEALKDSEEGEPWSIRFAQQQPISVAFTAGGFSITIRGDSYTRAGRDYPAMNVTASYQIEKTDQGFRAVRRALEIFPPGFSPEDGGRLSAREQVLRRMLERRFDQVFSPEIIPQPLTPKDRWAKVGTLVLVDWQATPGWMVMGWSRSDG